MTNDNESSPRVVLRPDDMESLLCTLRAYGRHEGSCPVIRPQLTKRGPCDCGLESAIAHYGALIEAAGEVSNERVTDARDGERYRWLRSRYVTLEFCHGYDKENEQEGHPAIVLSVPLTSRWPLPWPGVPTSKFDEAVDACMAVETSK